jgi:hypothetical protein
MVDLRQHGRNFEKYPESVITHYWCNLTLARLPGASEYNDGHVRFYLACPIWVSCLATIWASLLSLCFHCRIIFYVHCMNLIQILFLCCPKPDLRQYNIAVGEQGDMLSPQWPLSDGK